jgi:hypothetical protein
MGGGASGTQSSNSSISLFFFALLLVIDLPWMQGPVASLAGTVGPTGYLDETVVEGQVVSQRVLPLLRVLAVVGKLVHDELVNVTQRQHLLTGRLDGHGGESDVRIGRLLVAICRFTWSWHIAVVVVVVASLIVYFLFFSILISILFKKYLFLYFEKSQERKNKKEFFKCFCLKRLLNVVANQPTNQPSQPK